MGEVRPPPGLCLVACLPHGGVCVCAWDSSHVTIRGGCAFLKTLGASFSRDPPPPREPAPMALCDIHVAGCGEHPPAWGLRDDRIPGTDQAVRGGRHGQKWHSVIPPRQGDASGSADARSSAEACFS